VVARALAYEFSSILSCGLEALYIRQANSLD